MARTRKEERRLETWQHEGSMKIEELEGQAAILRVLLMLLRDGPLGISQLQDRIISSQSSLYNSINRLNANGLTREAKMTAFPFRRKIDLTKKGKYVAKKVAELSDILEKYPVRD